jgi:glutathione S-transferase
MKQGPYFLGARMCLVDVHLAPFALRLSRLAPFRDLAPPTPPARWKPWLDALEQNPHVRGTMSVDALYSQSMDDLLRGLQGMSD